MNRRTFGKRLAAIAGALAFGKPIIAKAQAVAPVVPIAPDMVMLGNYLGWKNYTQTFHAIGYAAKERQLAKLLNRREYTKNFWRDVDGEIMFEGKNLGEAIAEVEKRHAPTSSDSEGTKT